MDYIIRKASTFSAEEQASMGITGIPDNWPIEKYMYVDNIPIYFELICDTDLQTLIDNNQAAYDAWLQSLRPIVEVPLPAPTEVKVVEQIPPPPFAIPTFRTKRAAISNLIEIPVDSMSYLDYLITEERYIHGGTIIVENAQFGDYVCAEVMDLDGVIIEAYRSTLCENWPTVAKYIEKEWIPTNLNGLTVYTMDTYPLNAKIPAGFYLRITYYTTNSGTTRRAAVNYRLTKKI